MGTEGQGSLGVVGMKLDELVDEYFKKIDELVWSSEPVTKDYEWEPKVKELLREMIGQVVGRTIEWKKRPTG